jgi:uncharacterized delta-60 repeat protein
MSILKTSSVNPIGANGLTRVDDRFQLGGIITGSTTIDGALHNLLLKSSKNTPIQTTDLINFGNGFNNTINEIKVQSNNKILVGGSFTSFTGVTQNRLMRFNPDLTVDDSFTANLGSGFNSTVRAIAIQSDGKILVGGDFTSFNGTGITYLIRLNSDGTSDTSFNNNLSGFGNIIDTIVIQPDGKILVGGDFYNYGIHSAGGIVRLNSDGTTDADFNAGNGFGNVVCIDIQSNGKILLGGNFNSQIFRINSDGSSDGTFSTISIKHNTFLVQPDDKILVQGVRYLADGSGLDSTYNNGGSGFDGRVDDIYIQPDGKVIWVGEFTQFNGNSTQHTFHVTRLNVDGSEDDSYDNSYIYSQNGHNTINVYAIAAIGVDGNVLLGGDIYDITNTYRILVNYDISGNTSTGYTTQHSGSLNFVDGKMIVNGNTLEYNSDLSQQYTNRSLVDKAYVTGLTSSIPVFSLTNGIGTTANGSAVDLALTNGNGTTENGTTIDLGGVLTHNTKIDGNYLYNFDIVNMSGVTIASKGANSLIISGNTNSVNSNTWVSITYGAGLYVALSEGTNNIQTSPDGINWTLRTGATSGLWSSITYGSGLFVAVEYNSTNIQTSPDGINWTLRTGATSAGWQSLAYGAGLFVSLSSTSNDIQTSPDGITWTLRTGATSSSWYEVVYANGLFVAIAPNTTNIQTSPDGITWTLQTGSLSSSWYTLAYGAGLFVSIANGGNHIQTSPDGITWTLRTGALNDSWYALAFGGGLFVAAAQGSGNVQTSTDGINWILHTGALTGVFAAMAYNNGRFVSPAITGSHDILTVDYSLTFKGIEYGEDYSVNYSSRSLVDKGYVTGLISGSGSAGNGLSKVGSNIVLGGTLTGDTTIVRTGSTISLGDLNNGETAIQIFDGGILIKETGNAPDSNYINLTAYHGGSLITESNNININFRNSAIFGDESSNHNGLQYADNYSTGFTKYSLVDKNYVTGLTSAPNVGIISISANTLLALTNYLILIDTSTSGLTITLPASPTDGKVFKIKDKSGNALTNNITINGNSYNIDGSSTALINTNYGHVELTFSVADNQWFVTG